MGQRRSAANLHVWYQHVKDSGCKEIKTFMKTEDLLGYYDTFFTNASAESLNSKIKEF